MPSNDQQRESLQWFRHLVHFMFWKETLVYGFHLGSVRGNVNVMKEHSLACYAGISTITELLFSC